MSKFFPASARYAKAREFLRLRQGSMTLLEYVAKFKELARFGDDYVATDMAKVRKFEDGLKLSIRGKITGLLLQDMDSMVRTTMTIERERLMMLKASQMRVLVRRGRRISLLRAQGRSRGLLFLEDVHYRAAAIRAKDRAEVLAKRGRLYPTIVNSLDM